MRKIKKMLLAVAMVSILLFNTLAASAKTNTGTTAGGTLGTTSVTYTITTSGGSSTSTIGKLSISTANQVEKLGIKNINIVTSDGGGVTGGSTSKASAYTASYSSSFSPNVSITSISAYFYVTSSNFGSFSATMSLS